MGQDSKIEWTTHTFNPWVGCMKVSPGCDHCYAEAWAKRTGHPELWERHRRRTSASNWRQPYKWNKAAADGRRRDRVFCASLADVFDNGVTEKWRDDLFDVISDTPDLNWLLLTKRIGNVAKMLPDDWGSGWPNVWLGISVVNQEEADRDIPKLLAVPARVRFISYEPALGPIWREHWRGIDWIIIGGESGGHARPFDLSWARSIRDRCQQEGVACFVKQLGADPRIDGAQFPAERRMGGWDRKGGDWNEWPADLRVRQFPMLTDQPKENAR